MWLDNIKDWTRLSVDDVLDSTQDRTQWCKVVAALQRPYWRRDVRWTEKYDNELSDKLSDQHSAVMSMLQ